MPKKRQARSHHPALAAAAALAALAVATAGAASAKSTAGTTLDRRRQHVRRSRSCTQWEAPVRRRCGLRAPLQRDRLRRRHRGDHEPHGRLRRERRAAHDQFTACNGCVQIPWALAATGVIYNLPGVKNLLHMTGPMLAKIFLGKITKLERPGDQEAQQGASACRARRSRSSIAPTARARRSTSPTTSRTSARTWKSQVGTGRRGQLAGRRRASRSSSGVAGDRRADARRDRLRRRRVRPQRTTSTYFAMKNRSGKFATPG